MQIEIYYRTNGQMINIKELSQFMDKELKKMLVNLSEETRFSEPFYGNGAETFNKEIEIQMKALEEAISIEETKTAKELVMQIKEVLKNRNNSIKMLRRKGNQ